MNKMLNKEVNFSNDVFFKYALSSDDEASIFIRHSIIKELTGIEPMESKVLNPSLDARIIGKKGVILDVRVRDENGNEFNIEMQSSYAGTSDNKRFQLYLTRLYSNQLRRGANYDKLKPVFQIVFVKSYAEFLDELIQEYLLCTVDGKEMGGKSMIRSIFIYLPAINHIAQDKGILHMSAFEQLCYLFKNNEKRDILKSDKRLVKAIMEKYQNMQDNEDLWSIARAIEIGEMRTENHYKEGVEAALVQGRQEERFNMAVQFIKVKFNKDESAWLSTLTFEQLQSVIEALALQDNLNEVKKGIQ